MSERKPLTLEEMRKVPHGKIKDETLRHVCDRANEIAAEPTRLDRSAWEPCEHCQPSEYPPDYYGPHNFPIVDAEIYFYDTDDGWEGEEINFCPWCGRPLTDTAWEALERRMAGRDN